MVRLGLSLISLLLISGCTSLGKDFAPVEEVDNKKALVYVYRVPRFAGSAGSPYVCIDDKVVGEAVDGGYFPVQLSPGKHSVALKAMGSKSDEINFTVRPGKTYYLRSDFSARKGGLGAGVLGDAIWATSREDDKRILASLDKSTQKASDNPSLLFVESGLAKKEIIKSKEFEVPDYEKNYCKKQNRVARKRR